MALTRRRAVLGVLLLGGAVLACSAMVWARSSTSSVVDRSVEVTVVGGEMAPGVAAAGLVVLAAGLALALAHGWGRLVAGAVVAAGGVLVVAATAAAVQHAEAAVLAAAQETVGVARLEQAVSTTAAPWAALAVGVLAVLLGATIAVVSRTWPGTGGRHESPSTAEPVAGAEASRRSDDDDRHHDDHGTWDALSRGEDPT